jgi:outer membrane protein
MSLRRVVRAAFFLGLALPLAAAPAPETAPQASPTAPPKAAAKPAPKAVRVTLEQAVDLAMRDNPDIRKALQEIERTRGVIVEVRAQALPRAGLAGRYDERDPQLIETGGGGGGSTEGRSWNVALEVRQLLYSGGQVNAALNIADITLDTSMFQLRDAIDRVIGEVRRQFYEIVLNRALVGVQEQSVALLEEELSDQQKREAAGTVPRFNVLRAEVELANARPDLIRAKNNLRLARLRLAKTLGVSYERLQEIQDIDVVGDLPYEPVAVDLDRTLAEASKRRPFLQAQRMTILSEEQQLRVARGGLLPRIEASAGYEFRNSVFGDVFDSVIDGYFAGIEGSWAVFDGLETAGKMQQARARIESAKVNYEDSLRQVELEVQTAISRLIEAQELIESQRKNVEQAQEALRLARERTAAGAGTQLDVLDARVALIRAQTTELQARYEFNAALAELDRVTGASTRFHAAAPFAADAARKPRRNRDKAQDEPVPAAAAPQPAKPVKQVRPPSRTAVSHPAGKS